MPNFLASIGVALLIPYLTWVLLGGTPQSPTDSDQVIASRISSDAFRHEPVQKISPPPRVQLVLLLSGIGELENQGKTPLTSVQATQMLTIIQPWLVRPRMTNDQARSLHSLLHNTLQATQKKEIILLKPKREFALASMAARIKATPKRKGASSVFVEFPISDSELQDKIREVEKLTSLTYSTNPFFAPDSYPETVKLSVIRQKRMWEDHLSCLMALHKIEQKARKQQVRKTRRK